MAEKYFNINYEFDRAEVHRAIDKQIASGKADYISVADGVILDHANRDPEYLEIINSGMFAICDSSYVPLYLRLLYGSKRRFPQYCGAEIFYDIVSAQKYRMIFLGTKQEILDRLRENIKGWNPVVTEMQFVELPFCNAEDFDYEGIGKMVNGDGAEIIWVALGAPKQEQFMHRLRPHLKHGVIIAVGAAFKFYSGHGEKRAPRWMLRMHLEFVHRIMQEPRKQLKRCGLILRSLPKILFRELKGMKD